MPTDDDEIDIAVVCVLENSAMAETVCHVAVDALDARIRRTIADVFDRPSTDLLEILELDSGGDRGRVDHVQRIITGSVDGTHPDVVLEVALAVARFAPSKS